MSFFGQNPSGQGASGSNLFGGLNLNTGTDPQAKRKSIFDASTSQSNTQGTNQPSTQPAILGGLNTGASAPPSGGLFNLGAPPKTSAPAFSFGNTTTTTAPASTGLFGTAPTAGTSQPAATSSLFGGGSSFFGAPASKPAPTPSALGGANTQQSAAGSTFGQPGAQQPETGLPQNRDAGYFSSLLERQKKKPRLKTDNNGGSGPLSGLNMDLGDLARRAQELRSRSSKSGESLNDGRAHYLLAGSGVAPGQAYRDFQALGSEDTTAASRAQAQDFAEESSTYLRGLRIKGREALLREGMNRVYREVDSFIEESLGVDFEDQKLRIMEHFGLVLPEDGAEPGDSGKAGGAFGRSKRRGKEDGSKTSQAARSVFGRSALDKSMIGTPGSAAGTSSFFKSEGAASATTNLLRGQSLRGLREKEKAFVTKTEQLNQARRKGDAFPILEAFGEVEDQNLGDSPRQVLDAYHALREITKENSQAVKERRYAEAYLDESSTSARNFSLRKQILEGSRSYLEKAFWRDVRSLIEKNAREAALGGQPSIINIIRAYIRLRAARRDLAPETVELSRTGESGDYCWVLIFYLLRCGFDKEAADYVNNDAAFQSTDKKFVSYLTAYASSPDRRLSRKLQEMIDGEYQQRQRHSAKGTLDPYRMACYKVIGRCDLAQRSIETVGQGVEDWLWFQFALARETERFEEISGELYGLEQIREAFAEIGQKHFQKSQVDSANGYGTYFMMQILGGMFEQAVDYLHNFNPVSAVHVAIALSYYGLLRVSDYTVAGNELLTYSTTQQPLLNFVPLLAYYTGAFRTALPVAAVDYLSLICINADLKPASLGMAHTNACHECLRELCLETREFAKLLGDIRSDGTRIPGEIEVRAKLIKLSTREEFLRSITKQSAATADQRGQIADAVLMYHLCEDYDDVVSVLNRALADAVTLDLGESPMQLQPLKPRRLEGRSGSSASTQADGPQSSLSLTQSTSSPVDLARNMISLYNDNAAYVNKISPTNRETCRVLLKLVSARAHLESNPPRYMTALEELNDLAVLPLSAGGSIPVIRSLATKFGSLSQLLARCIGVSVVWAVRAIGGERDNIARNGRWEAGYDGDVDGMKDQLGDMAKDLMVFAGLVKYKLPGRVYDMLTRAGGDVGGF
ncbi:uncharacterized protein A1O9_04047 [Exophiala aquamarina CBS 119918]|uniref:Nuclear pore protein n=1 Tax=Exophiala aquamarina CBS 119918 TaxID=1182545 RepID=A0A072PIR5_9EURO|nr:uncharacterized protein A1O9_04047 [Exophiala aquamarina CBS 119918]KEF59203.1 hypothetical protein A1O9_04047 [Exophiala aquamarina CBS 119918]